MSRFSSPLPTRRIGGGGAYSIPPTPDTAARATIPPWASEAAHALGRVVRFPPLHAKLLSRPPFAYVHDILANLRTRSTIFDQHDVAAVANATTDAASHSSSRLLAEPHDDSSHEQRAKKHADEQKQEEQPQQPHSDDDHIPPHLWLLQNLPTRDLRLDFAARVLRHTEREGVLGRSTGVHAEDLVDAHHCEATCLWLTALAECALEHMRPSTVPESALAAAADAVAGAAAVTPVRIRHEVFNMISSSSQSPVRANLAAALDDAATATLPVAAAATTAADSSTAVAAPASPQSGGTNSSTLSARPPSNSDEARRDLTAASMPPPPVPSFDTASEPTEHSAEEEEEHVSDETVAFTRHLLRMFLPSSSLRSEARLRCPDFALMHELFVALAEQAGFGEGVFDQPVPQTDVAESKGQTDSDDAADAPLQALTHSRAAWLTSALRYAGLANGSVLPYTASELLDGRHPAQAHACLQRFVALALDHNMPAAQLLQRFKAGEVPSVRSPAASSVRY